MGRLPSPEHLAAEIEALRSLSYAELKERYRELAGGPAPKRIGRKLLTLAVAYEIQASGHRGLIARVAARLERFENKKSIKPKGAKHARSLKAGGRLIREWRGKTYEVYMAEDGVYMDGKKFRSLSAAAFAITGAKWNGPKFFGLRSPRTEPNGVSS